MAQILSKPDQNGGDFAMDNITPAWFPISRSSPGEIFVIDMSEYPGIRTICLQFSRVDSGCIAAVEVSNDRINWISQPVIRPYIAGNQKHSNTIGAPDMRILPIFCRYLKLTSIGRPGNITVSGFLSRNTWVGFRSVET